TLLLALTLAAYALAMTMGRGNFGALNITLLLAAVLGAALFMRAEGRAASPLIRLAMFRDPVLTAGLATSMLVSTVLMATLVVGPFDRADGLELEPALVGRGVSVGARVLALAGLPAGRVAARFRAPHIAIVGLAGSADGCSMLSVSPPAFGGAESLVPIVN